jgi:hypothetical protein
MTNLICPTPSAAAKLPITTAAPALAIPRVVPAAPQAAGAQSSRPCAVTMIETTAEDRCQGVLLGLAAGDKIGGPIRMALYLARACSIAAASTRPTCSSTRLLEA